MVQNLCDTHTHTLYSRHAYSTIYENVQAAKAAGLELLGSTDHVSDMLFPQATLTQASVRDFQFFDNYTAWPRVWDGIRLLHGCEVDIRGLDGQLYGDTCPINSDIVGRPLEHPTTLSERVFARCDYVIASVHLDDFAQHATVAEGTQMYLNVLQRDQVLMIGHAGRSGVAFELDTVIKEVARLHKIFEINEHSLQIQQDTTKATCRKIAETCAELGCQVALNTDAHICSAIGQTSAATALLDEIHFPTELIATRSADAFLAARDRALGGPLVS